VSISNAIKANKELNSTQNYFATTEGKAFLARPQDFQRSTEVDRKPAASKPKSADSGDENGDDSPPKIDLHNLVSNYFL
jgi:hypothetical protein